MTKRVEGLVAKWVSELVPGMTRSYDTGYNVGLRRCADELTEALAADRAEAGELPELPELPSVQRVRVSSGSYPMVNDPAGDYVDYDDHVAAMRTYGQQCARAASCGGWEEIGWVFQHEDTGRMTFCENDGINTPDVFARLNPRHTLCGPAYTTPPTPSAGVEVTKEMVARAVNAWCDVADVDEWRVRNTDEAIRAALTAALEGGK